jgi:nitroreductase
MTNLIFFYHAPTVIIVSGEEKPLMPRFDCAAATENMLIAAESIDIGSCWVGLVNFLFQTDKGNKFVLLGVTGTFIML